MFCNAAENTLLSAAQCRAARALLNWPQAELAEASNVGSRTIATFEVGNPNVQRRTLADLRRALEAAGVIFLAENGDDGPGVRLRKGYGAAATATKADRTARGEAEKAVDKVIASLPVPEDEKAKRKRRLTRIAEELKPEQG
jgi:transcriptional regulator with XRE-family HTH domain